MPKVSVIIPSYNHAGFIAEAVCSVLDQTLQDIELIIIDDGSVDNTREVLAQFTDPRMQVIYQGNQGAHAAINRGLGLATGRYLSILNSDDLYHPKRLEILFEFAETKNQPGLFGTHINIIDSTGTSIGVKHGYEDCSPWTLEAPEQSFRASNELQAALLTENYWSTTSNFFFPRQLYERVGEFYPLRYAHDWDFALRSSLIGDLWLLPNPLINYRIHTTNTIRDNQTAMIFEICWILACHLPLQIKENWFIQKPVEFRTAQLLNSIYTYGVDRVLNVLLLHDLAHNQPLAIDLLRPEHPMRKQLLFYIDSHQPQMDARSENSIPANVNLPGILRKILQRARNITRLVAR